MDTVTIGRVKYKISVCDTWRDVQNHPSEAEHLAGQISYSEQEIRLDGSMSDEKLTKIFLHEVIHGIVEAYHPEGMANSDGSHCEKSIDLLAMGMMESLESFGFDLTKPLRSPKLRYKR
jgi:hypothetical protein